MSRRDLFLTSEERFEVWQVKVAERPELVQVYHHSEKEDTNESNDNDSDNDDNDTPLPLTDGCDLPAWRGNLVHANEYVEACLHVGTGCPLLRREAQLPVPSTRQMEPWTTLRDRLYQIPATITITTTTTDCPYNTCTRIEASNAAVHVLHPWFERQNIPVLIQQDLTDTWPARHTLQWDALRQRFGQYEWRVSDTHAEGLTLDTFTKYVSSVEGGLVDDAPLALYDSQFHLDERAVLVKDYTVPTCFSQDLFALLDENETDSETSDTNDKDKEETVSRPPYRWILIGGARSGTGLHVDPVGTHAWVTLIQGAKRWVLFPPTVDRAAIGMQRPQIPSALWFQNWYDRAVALYPNDVLHVLQQPGETVYVPAGWPHIVLNLEPSVAITENYATPYPSLTKLWQAIKEESPALCRALQRAVRKHRPDLWNGNKEDNNVNNNNDTVETEDREEKKASC